MRAATKVGLLSLLAIALSGLGTGIWYLRSERFQVWARARAIAELEKATGLICKVDGSHFEPFRGVFRFEGFLLQSPAGSGAPVHIAADELSGSVRLISLVNGSFSLTELEIVRPHVILSSGQTASEWNPEEFLRSFRKSLEFAVGRVRVREGWIQFDNRKVPFDISLTQLTCEVAFIGPTPAYRMHVAFKDGQLEWAGRRFAYDLDVQATVSLEGIDFQSVGVRYNKTHISGDGWLRNWRSPAALFHASGTVAAVDLSVFDIHLKDARGDIAVLANFRWDPAGFRSTARFTCRAGSYHDVPVTDLRGVMDIEKGVLGLREVEGRLRGGPFTAEAAFHLLSSDRSQHRFQIDLKDTSLKDAAAIIDLPAIAYENLVSGGVRLTWRLGNRDLDITCNLALGGPPAGIDGNVTGLRGTASFRYAAGVWYLPSVDLHSPDTDLTAVSSSTTVFQLQLRTTHPAEIFGILRGFSSGLRDTLGSYPDLMALTGTYDLAGDVRVDPAREMAYQGSVSVSRGKWRTYSFDSLAARAYWDGNELDLQSLSARRGTGSANGSFHLTVAGASGASPDFNFEGHFQNVGLSTFRDFGLDYGEDVSGSLSGSGSISVGGGSWQGDGQIQLEGGSYKGEAFDSLRAHLNLRDDLLRIADCQLTLAATRLEIQGQVQLKRQEMDLGVKLAAFSLASLPAVQENKLEIGGSISVGGRLSGTLEAPAFSGSFDLNNLRYAGWEFGHGKGTVDLKNKMLQGDATVQSDLGSCKVHASISTEPGHLGSAALELKDWNLQKLISKDVPPYLSDLSTALQGKVDIEGSFADPASLNYHGEVNGARLKFHTYELSSAGKIRFTIAGKTLHVDEAAIIGEGTSFSLGGDIPVNGGPGLDLHLQGNLNLKLLEQLEKKLQVAGSAALSVRATGTASNPQIIGQATIKNTRLDYGELPFFISGLQGSIVFSRNLVRFESLQGSMAGGTVQVSGAIEHENAQLRGVNLQIVARKARIPFPKDFRSTVDADLDLRGGPDSQVLAGELRVIRGEYLKDYNLLEQLSGRGTTAVGPLTSDPFLVGLRLNVGIVSDEGLNIDNELTKLRGSMHLTLRGTPAYPSLTGRIEATEGSIFFRGNRFDIVRAAADFVDRNRINPQVEVRAEADVRSYQLVLDITGDLDHLRFNITSDPPLSTVDVLTLLTTGKESLPGTDTTRRQAEITGLSAASILSESLTGVLGKRVERLFGLQSFRVDPFLAGAENDPTARVTITERISKDVAVTFSRNLTTNEEQIIIVEYQVSKNVSVVGTRNENGEFGLDFRFRKRFH